MPGALTLPERLAALPRPVRGLLRTAGSLATGAALYAAIPWVHDDERVAVLAALAAVLAGFWRRLVRSGVGGVVADLLLGGLVVGALGEGRGPWVLSFGLAAVVAALAAGVVQRWGGRAGLALVLIGLLAGGTVGVQTLRRTGGEGLPTGIWNQFHYVLGSKYFDELGYFDLYPGVLLADEGRNFRGVSKVRNMRTYKHWTYAEALQVAREGGIRERFSDERWAQFQHDVEIVASQMDPRTRSGVLTDLGFNPSPIWLIVHRPLLNVVELGPHTPQVLAALQVPLYLLALAVSVWAFGLRSTLWMVLWTLMFWGNRGRLLAGYMVYDWFCVTLIAFGLLWKGREKASAPLLAWMGLMRGFPGMLAVGPAVHFLRDLVRARRLPSDNTRFLGVLAVCMALLGAASLGTARGADAWSQWHDKISFHSYRLSAGGIHLGMRTLFSEDYSEPGITHELPRRRLTQARQLPAYYATAGALSLWAVALMWRRGRTDAALLGLVPVYAGMTLSRYYYAIWVLFMVLGRSDERPEGFPLVKVGMFGVVSYFAADLAWTQETLNERYHWANVFFGVFCLVVLVHYTLEDGRYWRASRSR